MVGLRMSVVSQNFGLLSVVMQLTLNDVISRLALILLVRFESPSGKTLHF